MRVKTNQISALINIIEACKKKIAVERDKLRAAISDVEDVCDSSDDAIEELNRAVESLSKYL